MNEQNLKKISLGIRSLIIFVYLIIGTGLILNPSPSSANNELKSCSGNICTSVNDTLEEGVTGINPGQNVQISFVVYQESDFSAPTCSSGRNLYNAVRHYSSGSNYEYILASSGQVADHSFNSGTTTQQVNRYVGIFYCWTSSQETNKERLDFLLSTLVTQGQAWLSPEFNQQTRAAIIDVDCDTVSACHDYSAENYCVTNRCGLSPTCEWKDGFCGRVTGDGLPPGDDGDGLTPPGDDTTGAEDRLYNPLPTGDLIAMFLILGKGFLAIIGILAVVFIIAAGLRMIVSQGNEEATAQAKKALLWAVLGVVLASLSFSIIAIVENLLRANVEVITNEPL